MSRNRYRCRIPQLLRKDLNTLTLTHAVFLKLHGRIGTRVLFNDPCHILYGAAVLSPPYLSNAFSSHEELGEQVKCAVGLAGPGDSGDCERQFR